MKHGTEPRLNSKVLLATNIPFSNPTPHPILPHHHAHSSHSPPSFTAPPTFSTVFCLCLISWAATSGRCCPSLWGVMAHRHSNITNWLSFTWAYREGRGKGGEGRVPRTWLPVSTPEACSTMPATGTLAPPTSHTHLWVGHDHPQPSHQCRDRTDGTGLGEELVVQHF